MNFETRSARRSGIEIHSLHVLPLRHRNNCPSRRRFRQRECECLAGRCLGPVPPSNPTGSRYSRLDASTQTPFAPQAPLSQSVSATQPRHEWASQIARAGSAQSFESRHSVQLPDSQNLLPESPPKPGHSLSIAHVAVQSIDAPQNGAPASHCADVVQVSAIHVLPRHTSPPLQTLPSGTPLAAQSAVSVQQTSGLVLDPQPTNKHNDTKIVLMDTVSTPPRRSC